MAELNLTEQTWQPTHELDFEDGTRLLVMVPTREHSRQTALPGVARGWTASAWLHPEKLSDVRLEMNDLTLGINWFRNNEPLTIKTWRVL